jgi:hypothetical protein
MMQRIDLGKRRGRKRAYMKGAGKDVRDKGIRDMLDEGMLLRCVRAACV